MVEGAAEGGDNRKKEAGAKDESVSQFEFGSFSEDEVGSAIKDADDHGDIK